MHNLLRAFNNAVPRLSRRVAASRALASSSSRVPTNRSSACRTLIFHECFDVCFVSIRSKGGSGRRSGAEGRKEGRNEQEDSPCLLSFSPPSVLSRVESTPLSRSSSGLCPLADTTHNIVFIPQVYDVGSSREIDDCVTGF